jgi:hypothetical protein
MWEYILERKNYYACIFDEDFSHLTSTETCDTV